MKGVSSAPGGEVNNAAKFGGKKNGEIPNCF